MTLVELCFAMAAATVILIAAVAVGDSFATASPTIVSGFQNIRTSSDVFSHLRRDLGRARLESIGLDGSSITYRLPVKGPDDASLLDADGEVRWGVQDRSGVRAAGTATLSFVPLRLRNESREGIDLNGDSDEVDRFEEGHLILRSDRGDDLGLHRMRLLVAAGDRRGDVDGDGRPDPLFSLTSDNVLVVRLAQLRSNGKLSMRVIKVQPIECGVR